MQMVRLIKSIKSNKSNWTTDENLTRCVLLLFLLSFVRSLIGDIRCIELDRKIVQSLHVQQWLIFKIFIKKFTPGFSKKQKFTELIG